MILDAGPLVAMADRRDAAHEWTVSQLRRLREPLRCCGAVLAEASFVLRHFPMPVRRIRAEIERGNIIPEPESATV
ncbi:MAG TPA: hypothetical protein VGM54_22250 [Chthoniobacter sp.]